VQRKKKAKEIFGKRRKEQAFLEAGLIGQALHLKGDFFFSSKWPKIII
jgi:hypothetical protein